MHNIRREFSKMVKENAPIKEHVEAVVTQTADGMDRYPHFSSPRGWLRGLDWMGTVVFAAGGAVAAAESNMDLLGAIAVGTVTAVGGGTLRDVVILGRAPFWSGAASDGGEPEYLIMSAIAATLAFFSFPYIGKKAWEKDEIPDAIALGTFAVIGAMNGVRMGVPLAQSVMCGVFTGTGGGMIRDVWLKRPVRVFHSYKELYATAAASGAAAFLSARSIGVHSFGGRVALGLSVTCALRGASIHYGLRLPTLESIIEKKE